MIFWSPKIIERFSIHLNILNIHQRRELEKWFLCWENLSARLKISTIAASLWTGNFFRQSTKAGLKNPMNMKLDILYNLVLQDRWVYSLLNWPVCKLFTSLNHGRDRYGWLPKWSRIRVTGRLLERCWLWKESEKKVDMLVSAFMMGFLNMVFAKDEPMLLDYETANMCIINQSLFI